MKKHLIAAAVAAAVAAPAMAQNVSLYGTLDASYTLSDSGAASASRAQNMTDSAISSSVWGIRGSEDLGGGMKAIFNIEGDINLANGQTRTDSGLSNKTLAGIGSADAMFRRAANVGVQTSYGELTLGRRLSPAIGNSQALSVMSGNSVGSANQLTQGTAADFFTRQAITYVSPTFNGAKITAQQGIAGGLVESANTSTQPGDVRGTSSGYKTTAFALDYTNGPLTAGAAQQTVNNATGAKDHEFWNARVHYKFGDLTVGYGTQDVRIGSAATVFNSGLGKGPGVNSRSDVYSVAYQLNAATAVGLTLVDNNKAGTLTNVQVRNALSKRTTAYAQYGIAKADSTAAVTTNFIPSWGTATIGTADGKTATALSVGVIHTF